MKKYEPYNGITKVFLENLLLFPPLVIFSYHHSRHSKGLMCTLQFSMTSFELNQSGCVGLATNTVGAKSMHSRRTMNQELPAMWPSFCQISLISTHSSPGSDTHGEAVSETAWEAKQWPHTAGHARCFQTRPSVSPLMSNPRDQEIVEEKNTQAPWHTDLVFIF